MRTCPSLHLQFEVGQEGTRITSCLFQMTNKPRISFFCYTALSRIFPTAENLFSLELHVPVKNVYFSVSINRGTYWKKDRQDCSTALAHWVGFDGAKSPCEAYFSLRFGIF